MAKEARWDDPGVIEHEELVATDQLRQRGVLMMRKAIADLVGDEQLGVLTLRCGALGDLLGRKNVVKVLGPL